MHIFNTEYSHADVMRRSNNVSSLYYARRVLFTEGSAENTRAIEIKTAGGLHLLLNCSRCLDILELNYKGVNMGYLTNNGVNANSHQPNVNPAQDFNNYWIGGMLTTGGLRSIGEVRELDGEVFPKHGYIGTIPADQTSITVDDEKITVSGVVRQTALRSYTLELHRTITIPVDGATVHIHDSVVNNTLHDEPLFLLYHINFGFPFLDKGLALEIPEAQIEKIVPANAFSEEKLAQRLTITDPQDNVPATVYGYLTKGGMMRVEMKNRRLGMRAFVRYNADALPVLNEWNSMLSENYVLGIEPATSLLRGRETELKEKACPIIKPYDALSFDVEIGFADL
ncbi:MAG: aldose 1-epimerase family protein [Eubacteriales bacterium]|nr:aldose 1-epimerase family protein [Eubacteriales bacterium]